MKTIEDVYKLMIKLHDIGYTTVTKLSLYLPNVSFEFTELPSKEIYPFKSLHIVFYADETFDIMCERAERCLKEYNKFLRICATEDFISLLDKTGIQKYIEVNNIILK